MYARTKTGRVVLYLALIVLFISGCSGKINTAERLAEALKKQNVDYNTIESINTGIMEYGKINEGIVLKGPGLSIKIFRIEDKKAYTSFVTAGFLTILANKKIKKLKSTEKIQIYCKKPFAVIVEQEPVKGQTKQSLGKIFPKKKQAGTN